MNSSSEGAYLDDPTYWPALDDCTLEEIRDSRYVAVIAGVSFAVGCTLCLFLLSICYGQRGFTSTERKEDTAENEESDGAGERRPSADQPRPLSVNAFVGDDSKKQEEDEEKAVLAACLVEETKAEKGEEAKEETENKEKENTEEKEEDNVSKAASVVRAASEPVPTPLASTRGTLASASGRLERSMTATSLNFDEAKQHLKDTSPLTASGEWRSVWKTELKEMRQIGGLGMELYFVLLIILGICFAMMTALSLPLMLINAAGDFAPDAGPSYIRTTLGNLGNIAESEFFRQELRKLIVGCEFRELRSMTKYFSWADFCCMICFTCFVVYFRSVSCTAYRVLGGASIVSPSDYAVEINGLPEKIDNHATYEKQFAAFIADALGVDNSSDEAINACVKEVALARSYGGHLDTLKTRAHLRFKRNVAVAGGKEAALAKLDEQIQKLTDLLPADQEFREEDLPVTRAYVVLDTTEYVESLLEKFKYTNKSFTRFLFTSKLPRFHECLVRVKRAPEPSSLIWENIDTPKKERRKRWMMAMLAWVLLMLVSMGLVFGAKYLGFDQDKVASMQIGGGPCGDSGMGSDYVPTCDVMAAKRWNFTYAMTLDDEGKDCFCEAKGYSAIILRKALRNGPCYNWLKANVAKTALVAFCGLVVCGLNVILTAVLINLSIWQKPVSTSARESAIMVKVYVAQVMLTAFILVLVNFVQSNLLFGRTWYAVVGAEIVMVMVLNAFCVPISYIAFWWMAALQRRFLKHKAKSQADLLALFTNPPYDISGRLAYLLMTVFVCMLFSPGCPLLYMVGFMYCVLNYWADKWVLLHGSCRPSAFDTKMARDAATLLLLAVPAHCMAAIMMYSEPCVFPANPVGGALERLRQKALAKYESLAPSEFAGYTDSFIQRCSLETTWMFLVFFFFCGFAACFSAFASLATGYAAEMIEACAKRMRWSSMVRPADRADQLSWAEAIPEIEQLMPPASYRLARHPDFESISTLL
eukprot:TRINITY_DN14246_c0_g1_i1.p1 TRINITY_DN14246_c0_g1~~TRINITY_DN14246_c0_g1_i1.p1  ORF type:complete len:987 (-),score=213.50 TRINITY_DN14246_c0_g1_i1:257-3217(-)